MCSDSVRIESNRIKPNGREDKSAGKSTITFNLIEFGKQAKISLANTQKLKLGYKFYGRDLTR